MKFFLQKQKNERGFTELYAVLVGSLILSIGLAILNITLKEFLLSSSARESQIAFFATDAGTECALYWDLVNSGATNSAFLSPPSYNIATGCSGANVSVQPTSPAPGCPTNSTCVFSMFSLASPITTVTVSKITDNTNQQVLTTIDSKGYNAPAGTPNRVERAIRVQY